MALRRLEQGHNRDAAGAACQKQERAGHERRTTTSRERFAALTSPAPATNTPAQEQQTEQTCGKSRDERLPQMAEQAARSRNDQPLAPDDLARRRKLRVGEPVVVALRNEPFPVAPDDAMQNGHTEAQITVRDDLADAIAICAAHQDEISRAQTREHALPIDQRV